MTVFKPSHPTTPFELRDFSKGRQTSYSMNNYLLPKNSAKNSVNVNFDTVIGSAVVRPWTTLLGSNVASGKSPIGFTEFVGKAGSPNLTLTVFPGASTASIYYYDTSWHTSAVTTLNNTATCRFATIGGRVFLANGASTTTTDHIIGLMSSSDGNNWDNTNCAASDVSAGLLGTRAFIRPTLIIRSKQRLLVAGDTINTLNKDRVFFSSIIQPNVITQAVTSITRSGSLVIVTTTATNTFNVYDYITISGADQTGYNGSWMIQSIVSPTVFQFILNTTPTSPATGTILVSESQLQWNTDITTGYWIDINPDDGNNITAFAETADQTLIFKSNAMYRLDVINKSVDSSNIFNVGAVSQEAVTDCQGIVYFYSGDGIYRTNGGFPELISRLGCQDFLDAIPVENQSAVSAGHDRYNVWFSLGDITLNTGRYNQRTYNNVVVKFSVRDETWSIHSYAQKPVLFSRFYTSTNGRKTIFADSSGNVQTLDLGQTDNGTPIYFEMETQELELGNRAHVNNINDLITVYTNNGIDSKLQFKADEGDYKDIKISLDKRVNTGDGLTIQDAHYITFKWYGNSSGTAPVFEGLYLDDINDEGQVTTQ